jgi:hypothetical protein
MGKGLSTLVGILLIVAMTTLSAIIVWGYLSPLKDVNNPRPYYVGLRVEQIGINNVTLRYLGGPDHSKLVSLRITGVNSKGDPMKFYTDDPSNATEELVLHQPSVGTYIYSNNATLGIDHIIVVAEFSDGTELVVLNAEV